LNATEIEEEQDAIQIIIPPDDEDKKVEEQVKLEPKVKQKRKSDFKSAETSMNCMIRWGMSVSRLSGGP